MYNNFRMLGGNQIKWTVFRHNGPMFPDPYVPHNIPIIVNGNKINLEPKSEEVASLFAKYIKSQYMENNTFKKNFFNDFKKHLPKTVNVNSIDEIDFSQIYNHLEKEREQRLNMSKEEKERIKKVREKLEEPYKYCIIDGAKQTVGNYKIEPPGIFMGRGTHPKMGKLKSRIMPEDVTINIDKESKIPDSGISGHKWGKVIHDRSVIWLASWKDSITGKSKYIFTSVDSFFKSKSDEKKFDLAKKLKKKIASIRRKYEEELESDKENMRQISTALYIIDKFALRVGGKKDKKTQADTVGVTSLRVEHISFPKENIIKLDFLGKDSIRFCKKLKVISPVYQNLIAMSQNKNKKDKIFHLINSSILNNYLKQFMDGLTAKVWRTYNASNIFQKELDKIKKEEIDKLDENIKINYLLSLFNQANTTVALLCNHQKAVSKNFDSQIQKLNDRIKDLQKKKRKYQEKKKNKMVKKTALKIRLLKTKRNTKEKMKNVSLTTSKNNYIDPRIIVGFMKKFNIPFDKIFNEKLIKRFEWAISVDKDYKF